MRVHHYRLKAGINKTPEFEKKKLASFAVNCGIKCGHDCRYCSTGAMLRMHEGFKACGENPFHNGYAIVDPTTPERVARDARKIRQRGLVQLCTVVDACGRDLAGSTIEPVTSTASPEHRVSKARYLRRSTECFTRWRLGRKPFWSHECA